MTDTKNQLGTFAYALKEIGIIDCQSGISTPIGSGWINTGIPETESKSATIWIRRAIK